MSVGQPLTGGTSALPAHGPTGAATEEEHGVIAAIGGMLARPDFLIPIVAAERQFREHYYGLTNGWSRRS